MKRIEAIVGTGELGSIRDALREIGVRTMRVTEVEEDLVPVFQNTVGRAAEPEHEPAQKSRVGVVVPDDLADRVILVFLANLREGGIDDGSGFVSSIEHVVRLEAEGFFEDVI